MMERLDELLICNAMLLLLPIPSLPLLSFHSRIIKSQFPILTSTQAPQVIPEILKVVEAADSDPLPFPLALEARLMLDRFSSES